MKIFYITTSVHISANMSEAIGATTHTLAISKELQKLGHEIHIISEKLAGDNNYDQIDNLHVHRLLRGIITTSTKLKSNPFTRVAFRSSRIVTNTLLANKIKQIADKTGCDLIIERAHCRGVGARLSYLTHKPLILETIDYINSPLSIHRASKIIAYTKAFFNTNSKPKVTLVNAGFDPDIFKPYPVINKKYDIAYAGAFKEWDGLEDLVKATSDIIKSKPNLKILLIGSGKRYKNIKKLISTNNLNSNFILLGKIPLPDVSKKLSESKIAVAPFNTSNYPRGRFNKYGFYFSPLKIFEYMATGLPVIASNYSLISKVIKPTNGLLFSPGNIEELKQHIYSVLDNPNTINRISTNNIQDSKKYTWENVAKTFENTINSL